MDIPEIGTWTLRGTFGGALMPERESGRCRQWKGRSHILWRTALDEKRPSQLQIVGLPLGCVASNFSFFSFCSWRSLGYVLAGLARILVLQNNQRERLRTVKRGGFTSSQKPRIAIDPG